MSENKYGHLLDKYMEKSNNSNKILNDFKNRKKEEGEGRYGNLLDNVGNYPTIYDKMMDVENAMREMKRKEAEEQSRHEQDIKEKRERKEQELQTHRDKNTAFVEDYLSKKKAEQEAIEKKKKEEAEQAEIYKHIEKLMETSPKAAEAYADIYANKLKKI